MERNNSHITWGYHYVPSSPLLSPHALYPSTRETNVVSRYPYSTMASDRPGNYIAPCYWPSPYSTGPYGVSPQHGGNSAAVKRPGMNPCECSACVTTSTQAFKPAFSSQLTDNRKSQTPEQVSYPQKEIPSRESNDGQNYTANKGNVKKIVH